jgi:hypothetical protein
MTIRTLLCSALVLAGALVLPARADPPLTIALRYDSGLRKIGFPSPLLTVKIAGQEARFLVDSGAGVHTFAAWYVKAAALQAVHNADVHAVDAGGRAIDVLVVRNAQLALTDGTTLTLAEGAVAEFPPIFEQLRIAGLVSPQLLATPSQAAVLDLNRPELRLEAMEPAVDRLNATIQGADGLTRVCSNKASPLTNRLYLIRTLVDGIATSLTIDTGATSTSISDGIPAAHALRRRPGTGRDQMGIGGTRVRVFQSAPVLVDFGGGPRRLSIAVGPNADGCGSQGVLGMDALAGCRWVFGNAAFAMSCVKAR